MNRLQKKMTKKIQAKKKNTTNNDNGNDRNDRGESAYIHTKTKQQQKKTLY